MTYTANELRKRGYDAAPLERAFAACFTHAATATTGTVQALWNQFVAAHRVLRGGGEMREAA